MTETRTTAQVAADLIGVAAEVAKLARHDKLTGPQELRFEGLKERWTELTAEHDELAAADRQAKLQEIARGAAAGEYHLEHGAYVAPGSDQRTGGDRLSGVRSQAMRLLDSSVRSKELPEHAAERVETLLTTGRSYDQELTARWVTTAGAPEYRDAFAKLLADPVRGHLLWTDAESRAYRAVSETRAAMSLTDANGGYMVPLTLDPAIMLTSDGSMNPLRRISRVVQTVTDQWQGVSSAGATAEWKAEAAEAADGSPTVGDEPIAVHFGDVFVPYSYEVGMDARNFLGEITEVMRDAADQLQATAYTTGTGTGQPKGIVTALAGTASEINGGGSEVLAAADAFTLQNALPPRFQPRAQWMAHLATINTFRQFETTNGALKFPELANGQLLNRAVNENSNMDGSINAAATANNYLMVYCDFRHFVIVDRIGTQIELLPNLVGANRRPTGQRGLFLWFRTGSDVVVPQAFRMLDVPTTA